MAALDPVVGNALNDVLLANAASGSVNLIIGSITYTAPYACRFDSVLGVAGTAGTVIAGTSSVAINGLFANASASVTNVPTKANTAAISITTTSATGSPWNGVEIFDANATTPKRILFGPTAGLAKAFASGDILSIPIGNMSLTTT